MNRPVRVRCVVEQITERGFIDQNEFGDVGIDGDFDTRDADSDSYLDSGEFYDGVYTTYDANENGHWDNGEWDDAGESGWLDR